MQPSCDSLVSLSNSKVLLVGSWALLKVCNSQQLVKLNKIMLNVVQNVQQQFKISPKRAGGAHACAPGLDKDSDVLRKALPGYSSRPGRCAG